MVRLSRTAGMLAVALALVMVGVYARSTDAASGPVIAADLGGRPIPAVDVGRYQCEDFDFPRIHSYRTAAELEAAVARRLAAPAPAGPGALATTLATNYVLVGNGGTFFEHSHEGVRLWLQRGPVGQLRRRRLQRQVQLGEATMTRIGGL